jgi:uncharacterized Zn finger protein
MSTDLRTRALPILREGRACIVRAEPGQVITDPAWSVIALVTSSRTPDLRYVVDFDAGEWACTCGAGITTPGPCAHVAAIQLVTGHADPTLRGVKP